MTLKKIFLWGFVLFCIVFATPFLSTGAANIVMHWVDDILPEGSALSRLIQYLFRPLAQLNISDAFIAPFVFVIYFWWIIVIWLTIIFMLPGRKYNFLRSEQCIAESGLLSNYRTKGSALYTTGEFLREIFWRNPSLLLELVFLLSGLTFFLFSALFGSHRVAPALSHKILMWAGCTPVSHSSAGIVRPDHVNSFFHRFIPLADYSASGMSASFFFLTSFGDILLFWMLLTILCGFLVSRNIKMHYKR